MAEPLTLRDADREARHFTHRVVVLFMVVLALMLVLTLRMVQLQVLEYSEYATRSEENRIQVEPVAPTRGLIYDRNGILLAENQPVFSLRLVKERVGDLDAVLARIDGLIDLDGDELDAFRDRLTRRRRPFEPVTLRVKLSEDDIATLAVNRYALPGVQVDAQPVRHYPLGPLLAHAIGSVRRINADDLERLDPVTYSATRWVGKLGVEKHYETALHGQVGYQQVETDARGRVRSVLSRTPPVPGQNLTLHLDSRLQIAAAAALGDRRGAVVAMEPATGGVLALVSQPGYDPNRFVLGIDTASYAELRDDIDTPLFNRALQGQYAPGSTFKPVVGLAAVAHGVTDWQRIVEDPGWFQLPGSERIYRDWNWTVEDEGGHGDVHLGKAIYRSSNTYFYTMGVELGIDRLHNFARQFGFGQPLALDLPEARGGLLPDRVWKRRVRGEAWYPGDSVNLGIGQGDMLVTPLQMAAVGSTIANRGQPVRPRMLLASDAPLGSRAEPLPRVRGVAERDWERMVDAMEAVVHRGNQGRDENGTAWAYIGRDIQYRMAGKSGTAQVVGIAQGEEYEESELEERQRKHAWFIAFAPADDPQIAVAVLVENGGGGSSTAAPVAREVIDAYLLPRLDVARRTGPIGGAGR